MKLLNGLTAMALAQSVAALAPSEPRFAQGFDFLDAPRTHYRPRPSRYMPHEGKREVARRRRQRLKIEARRASALPPLTTESEARP